MECPNCGGKTTVVDNSYNNDAKELYRKRKCTKCGHEFCTMEFEIDISDQLKKEWCEHHRTHTKIFPDRKNTILTKEQVEYIRDHYNETSNHISKVTGIPLGTVKYHIYKFRKELKQYS